MLLQTLLTLLIVPLCVSGDNDPTSSFEADRNEEYRVNTTELCSGPLEIQPLYVTRPGDGENLAAGQESADPEGCLVLTTENIHEARDILPGGEMGLKEELFNRTQGMDTQSKEGILQLIESCPCTETKSFAYENDVEAPLAI